MGDPYDYWAIQLIKYGDYLYTISYDHVGKHYDQFVWYDRDAQEDNRSWMVNPVPRNDDLWFQIRGEPYSWGVCLMKS